MCNGLWRAASAEAVRLALTRRKAGFFPMRPIADHRLDDVSPPSRGLHSPDERRMIL
jgi:hypothetical protein